MNRVHWQNISTVFLDMDGTLLDLQFDNHFWLEHVPKRYGEIHGIELDKSKKYLRMRYDSVRGRLDWYCMDYWSRELGLDIEGLKKEIAHMISVRPYVTAFLQALRVADKRLVLLTNAHQQSVDIKLAKTGLTRYFDRIVVSHDLGKPKESNAFWPLLQHHERFIPIETILVDDNLDVLRAASKHGIAHLVAIKRPDTRGPEIACDEFFTIEDFREILP